MIEYKAKNPLVRPLDAGMAFLWHRFLSELIWRRKFTRTGISFLFRRL